MRKAKDAETRRRGDAERKKAFSLLEVILALAILAGAIAVLGEVTRQSLRNTQIARDATYAELLCESKMAEIVAGVEYPETVQGTPYETVLEPSQPPWLYSVRCDPTIQEGVLAVAVTVEQDLPPEKKPVRCTLVRWMMDPTIGSMQSMLDEELQSQSSTSGTSGTSGTTMGATQ